MNTPPIQESGKAVRTPLAKGNEALRQGNHAQAIAHYAQAIIQQPGLAKIISRNIEMARHKYRASRQTSAKPSIAVCGWELAHNSAGRAYTLATIYETFAHVEIIGSLFPSFGREIWEPIRDTPIAKHTFIVEDESKFLEQAIQLVAAHPYDIVHLSKPRAPNIFFGILEPIAKLPVAVEPKPGDGRELLFLALVSVRYALSYYNGMALSGFQAIGSPHRVALTALPGGVTAN